MLCIMNGFLHNTMLRHYIKDYVTSSKPRAFSKDLLQFLGGSASDEGSDQGQGVRVEIGLKRGVISFNF